MEVADWQARIRMLIILVSKGRALAYPCCAWKISCLQAGVPASLNPPSGNGSLNYAFVIERNASGREFESVSSRTNSSYPSETNLAPGCKNAVDEAEDNFVHASTALS